MDRKRVIVAVCLCALCGVASAGYEGYPWADSVTNYLSLDAMFLALTKHPMEQLVDGLNERRVAAGLTPLLCVSTQLYGPQTNEVSVVVTNEWGWYPAAGAMGWVPMSVQQMFAFDTALASTVPVFVLTNACDPDGVFTTYFGTGAADFPMNTMTNALLVSGAGIVTNGGWQFTRFPRMEQAWPMGELTYTGAWLFVNFEHTPKTDLYCADLTARPVALQRGAYTSDVTVTLTGKAFNPTNPLGAYVTTSCTFAVSGEATAVPEAFAYLTAGSATNTASTGAVVAVCWTNTLWYGPYPHNIDPANLDERVAVLNECLWTRRSVTATNLGYRSKNVGGLSSNVVAAAWQFQQDNWSTNVAQTGTNTSTYLVYALFAGDEGTSDPYQFYGWRRHATNFVWLTAIPTQTAHTAQHYGRFIKGTYVPGYHEPPYSNELYDIDGIITGAGPSNLTVNTYYLIDEHADSVATNRRAATKINALYGSDVNPMPIRFPEAPSTNIWKTEARFNHVWSLWLLKWDFQYK